MNKTRLVLRFAGVLAVSFISGCSLAPTYHVPITPLPPAAYKELGDWQPVNPSDPLILVQWWLLYQDGTLNHLEIALNRLNPDLAAALAHYDAARAYVSQAEAGQFPTVSSSLNGTRNRQSDNRPLRGSNQPDEYNTNTAGVAVEYELDFWGRVRNQVIAGKANAVASGADLASMRLSLQAELANSYFKIRSLDAQQKLLLDTLNAYQRALTLTQTRHDGGIASGLDVSRAQTQYQSAQAELTDVAAQRALYEHAIASLVGESASTFTLPVKVQTFTLPEIPVSVPSTLLQRRPDIAAAERRVAAANADIGVARAAYYPNLTLTAVGGYQNTGGVGWLTAPNSFWSIGPSALLTLFDAGRHKAQVAEARAHLDEAGANYRAVVLKGFQQVEDSLSQLNLLKQEAKSENDAVTASSRTLNLAMIRYREGIVSYLDVVNAQAAALQTQRTALDINTRRIEASVGLIRALGGGWSRTDLSTNHEVAKSP